MRGESLVAVVGLASWDCFKELKTLGLQLAYGMDDSGRVKGGLEGGGLDGLEGGAEAEQ